MKSLNLTQNLVCVLALLCAVGLWAQSPKPISLKGLVDALNTHGLSSTELVQIVKSRGVDFELTSDAESELKAAGADADLLAAVRGNYRGASASDKAQPPAAPPAASQPPPEQSKANVPANAPVITSIRDVKKLYIEKMPNDLDEYIKAEISRQMPGRLLIVLHQEGADAVMRGTATNRSGNITITDLRGTAELWVGEAGDKGIYLTKVHGGEKKVAERLVSNLKKALQK